MAEAETLVVMLVPPAGDDGTNQWFDFRTHFFGEAITLKWPNYTSLVLVPTEFVGYLIRNKYARVATLADEEKEQANQQEETKS